MILHCKETLVQMGFKNRCHTRHGKGAFRKTISQLPRFWGHKLKDGRILSTTSKTTKSNSSSTIHRGARQPRRRPTHHPSHGAGASCPLFHKPLPGGYQGNRGAQNGSLDVNPSRNINTHNSLFRNFQILVPPLMGERSGGGWRK